MSINNRLMCYRKVWALFLTLLTMATVSFTSTSVAQGLSANTKQEEKTIIQVLDKPFQVDGKGKSVKSYELVFIKPDGTKSTNGYFGKKGEMFNVLVENKSSEATVIHWHGLILPNDQDGVPDVTQQLIQPGESHAYHFPLLQAGTFWMHSHQGLQEQQQLSAPLIISESSNQEKTEQEAVLFLEDFTYKDPKVILKDLQKPMKQHQMKSSQTSSDYNDVDYNTYLTNKRSLLNPQVVTVTPGKNVRLRIINGSASTNFQIDLGKLKGMLIAVDGENIKPINGKTFPIGIANRLDIIIKIPKQGGVFPILGFAEGTNQQTGLILATAGTKIPKYQTIAKQMMERVNYYQLEKRIKSKTPLTKKPVDTTLNFVLEGTMNGYKWTINKEMWPNVRPNKIKKGDRVEMVFKNQNAMSHPMHLHGHVFQVTEIDGQPLTDGARRDTVLVQPNSTVKVQFDANNPGVWALHCHNLYHLNAGMFTTIEYQDYPLPDFYLKKTGQN